MKVLLLSNFFSPEKTGIGVTATDSARFIRDLGHDIEVVTTVPYYPEWEVLPEYRNRIVVNDEVDGIQTTRVWMYIPRSPSTLKRILHELSGAIGMALTALFKRSDLLFCISPPLPMGFLSMVVAKIRGMEFWCYVLDIQPDAAIDLGMIKNPIVAGFSSWMEKWMYRGASKIIVLSEGMKENLLRKSVPEEKITIIPNAVDVSEIYLDREPKEIFRERYGLKDKFLVLYSGNLGIKHNVEIIVHAANALKEKSDIHFAIVGDGAARNSVEKLIQEYNLDNVALYPLAPREELPDMLASADLLLAPQRKEVKDIVVPSKLLSYLSSMTPVVASVLQDSESARLLKEYDAGIIIEPENHELLAETILQIKEDPDRGKQRAANGLRLVRELYDSEVVQDKYYKPLFLPLC